MRKQHHSNAKSGNQSSPVVVGFEEVIFHFLLFFNDEAKEQRMKMVSVKVV
jgi:hypothetical protein